MSWALVDQRCLVLDRLVERILEDGVELGVGVAAEHAADTPAGRVEEEEQMIRIGVGVRLEHRHEHVDRRRPTLLRRTPGGADGGRVKRLDGDLDADLGQLFGDQLTGADLGRGGGVDQEGEGQGCAVGGGSDPVVAGRIAGFVEHRRRGLRVVLVTTGGVGPRRIRMGPGVVAGPGLSALDGGHEGVEIERHAHRLAHRRVVEDRLAHVEHEVLRLHAAAGDDLHIGVAVDRLRERGRHVAGHEVELAGLQGGEGGLGVGHDRHDQLVDQRGALEVVGVGLQSIRLARLVVDHPERTGADRQRGGVGPGILDALPDVLREGSAGHRRAGG